MGAFSVESSRVTHDGVLSTVRIDRVRMPDGGVAEREVVGHPGAVAVVAVDDEGRVVLLRQYRHPVGRVLLEIPAGKLDVPEEIAEVAARRELLEEVGLEAGSLEHLVTFHNSAGWCDELTTIYLGRDLREGTVPPDFTPKAEEADMTVERMPLSEAVTLAEAGEIPDAKTLIGLLLAGLRLAGTTAAGAQRQRA